MMLKILRLSQSKKRYLMIISDNLIYRYKGNTDDEKFDKFDNALNITNKIQNGEISLTDVKSNQQKFKSYLGEKKKKKKRKQ